MKRSASVSASSGGGKKRKVRSGQVLKKKIKKRPLAQTCLLGVLGLRSFGLGQSGIANAGENMTSYSGVSLRGEFLPRRGRRLT